MLKRTVVLWGVLLLVDSAFGQTYPDGSGTYPGSPPEGTYVDALGRTDRSGSYIGGGGPQGVWDGYPFIVIVTTDDGYGIIVTGQNTNIGYAAAAESMGTWAYTMDIRQGFIKDGIDPPSGAGAILLADLQDIVTAGVVEIASTGRINKAPTGIANWTVDADLRFDIGPSWVDSLLSVVATSYCQDLNYINYDAMRAVADSGYTSFRGSIVGGGFDSSYGVAGSPRMDFARHLKWDEPSALFGFASILAEGSAKTPPSVFGGIESYPDSLTNRAQLENRLGLLIDESLANGGYPVVLLIHNVPTREQMEWTAEYVLGRGGLLTTQRHMVEIYRDAHTAVDPPGWAIYAKLDGVVAADEFFWDLDPTAVSCATTSTAIFHNNTTAVTIGDFDFSYTDSITYNSIRPVAPSTPIGIADNLYSDFHELPISAVASTELGMMSFNVTEMRGKEIESAVLHYLNTSNAGDISANDGQFFSIIGVTVPEILSVTGQNDMSYDYKDTSELIPWVLSWEDFTWVTNFGEFSSVNNNEPASTWVARDHTEYVRHVADNNLQSATFAFHGVYLDGARRTWRPFHSGNTAVGRPYLVVTFCD